MSVQNKILSVVVPNPETGADFEMNMLSYKRFLLAAQTPEGEILNRMKQAVEPYKKKMMDLGFTEEEADARILSLIEEESSEPVVEQSEPEIIEEVEE